MSIFTQTSQHLAAIFILFSSVAFISCQAEEQVDTSISQSTCETLFSAEPGQSPYCICYANSLSNSGLDQQQINALAEYSKNTQIPNERELIMADQKAQRSCSPF